MLYNLYKVIEKAFKNCKREVNSKRSTTYVNRFNALGTDPNRSWKLLNSVIGKSSSIVLSHLDIAGTEVTDVKQLCDKFNSHFTMNSKSVHDSIPSYNANFYGFYGLHDKDTSLL